MRTLTLNELALISGGTDAKSAFGTVGGVVGAYYGFAAGAVIGITVGGFGLIMAASAESLGGAVLAVALGGSCIVGGIAIGALMGSVLGYVGGAVTDAVVQPAKAA